MQNRRTIPTILTFVLGVALLGCRGNEKISIYDNFQSLHSLEYSIESKKSPFVAKWKNRLEVPYGKTAELDASSFSTIWKSIKYSDEPQARTILEGYLGDYNLIDIRLDSKRHQLLLLTGGSIWSDDFRNHYLFCYDLSERKVMSQTLVPADLFSKIQTPEP
jgi:hypothetical protein